MSSSGLRALLPASKRILTRSMSTSKPSSQAAQLGAREKLLLEEDPALKAFSSQKAPREHIKKVGDVLVLMVVSLHAYFLYRFRPPR
eukprot:jgi/Mesen1/9750/ME000698S09230